MHWTTFPAAAAEGLLEQRDRMIPPTLMHYRKVVTALSETIHLMAEIDTAIPHLREYPMVLAGLSLLALWSTSVA
jgi:hypothetical protein